MDGNLRSIVSRQKDIVAELDSEVRNIENSDLSKENERLKAELDKLNEAHFKAQKSVKELSAQNAGLKNALHEQIYNEKVKIISASKNKLDIFFKSSVEGEMNKLTALENNIKAKISGMTDILQRNNVDIKDDAYHRLEELSDLVNIRVTEAQKQYAQSHGAFSEVERDEFKALKNEQITDRQMLETAKKNNFERFVGLNLLNVVGIFLIIIGVITAARYTYVQLPNELKAILIFVLGAAMLGAGEFLNRKKPNIFSLGITAGGVGVLYVALAVSYFGLKLLDMYPALGLCVLITAAAFFLSTRYNSQTVLAFALVGGYLPLISLGTDKAMLYGAMAYFVVLNLLALLVSTKKKWSVSSFVGLILNIAGTIYICTKFGYNSDLTNKIIAILYILFAFLSYTLIPIVSTYADKSRFRKRDVVLLAVNTFFSSIIMYAMFYTFSWEDYTGALAVAFAAIYLLIGRLIEQKFNGERNTQALFYLTGFAFVVLVVPLQFGSAWLSLGWLAEGVALTSYGILQDEKNFKRTGFTINSLCLFAFIFVDMFGRTQYLFAYKYLAMTLGSVIILAAYVYKRTMSSRFQKLYKYAVIVNLWFYIIHICNKLGDLIWNIEHFDTTYLTNSLAIALTFMLAYFSLRIKILSDRGVKIIAMILYAVGTLQLFVMNAYRGAVWVGDVSTGAIILGSVVLVLISLLSVFAVHSLVKLIVMERKLGVEWYPLMVSAYFVTILTQNLITQYDLSFASAWVSIIYVLTALAWIVFGFVKRYSFIRKFGLGLALMSVVKLFIIDMGSLTQGYRIVSYFSLGITLVAISFVYQYFNKRLELKTEVAEDASENN